jgi:NAD(P)H-dependent FMN reductase
MQIKILALCGSSRRDSLNQKLLDIAALGAVDAGAQVSLKPTGPSGRKR